MSLAPRRSLLLAVTALLVAPAPASALTETPDQTAQAVGKVFAIASDGDRIFVGGEFKAMRGPGNAPKISISNLGAITMSSGALVTSFTPQVTLAGDTVRVGALGLSPDGTTLYLGGRFDHVDGQAFSNFAAVNAVTGDLIPGWDSPGVGARCTHWWWRPTARSSPAARSSGRAGGPTTGWRPSSETAPSITPSMPRPTTRCARSPWRKTSRRSSSAAASRRWTAPTGRSWPASPATTGALDQWAIPAGVIPPPQNAWVLVPRGPTLYVGLGHGPNFASAFRLDNGNTGTQIWRRNFVGNVESLAFDAGAGRLYFGGHMGTNTLEQNVCGRPLSGLGYMDPATGTVSCTWVPQIAPSTGNGIGAWTLMLTGNQLWVGGRITSIGGVTQSGIARFTL